MSDKDIQSILRYPNRNTVCSILNHVNLEASELIAIKKVDMEGYTEEKTAQLLDVSKRTIQNYRKNAYRKIKISLNENTHLLQLLKAR